MFEIAIETVPFTNNSENKTTTNNTTFTVLKMNFKIGQIGKVIFYQLEIHMDQSYNYIVIIKIISMACMLYFLMT